MKNNLDDRYTSGEYLTKNPTFHVERAEFKARLVAGILARHQIQPKRICDLGCGAGEVLSLLSQSIPTATELHGYELSPQGFQLCQERKKAGLSFFNQDLFETTEKYDLGISMDVFEHVEDPFTFLREFRKHATKFVFHIPLDMSVQMVLRGKPIMSVRQKLGHLHYFSKDSALALLKDTGFKILDHEYTPSSIYKPNRLSARLASIPRILAKTLMGDFGVRLIGGYSLLVLAE